MEIRLINGDLLSDLHKKSQGSERLRTAYDMRNTEGDTSQRMLNVLEPGTYVQIHRHLETSESVVCLEGCLDWVFYEEQPAAGIGVSIHEGENPIDETRFKEVARFRICPREGLYGIQVPKMAWHSIVVHEPSTIFEAMDGAWRSSAEGVESR